MFDEQQLSIIDVSFLARKTNAGFEYCNSLAFGLLLLGNISAAFIEGKQLLDY